ncbi:MAG: hypothetical protein HW375_18 [Anaerolineales bacterium]|nr:hypothetical protein [Anaerolineales bacterium]
MSNETGGIATLPAGALGGSATECERCGGRLFKEPASPIEGPGDWEMNCVNCGAIYPCRPADMEPPARRARAEGRRNGSTGIRDGSITDRFAEGAARRVHRHRTIRELYDDEFMGIDAVAKAVGLTVRSVQRHLARECQCELLAETGG